MTIKTYSRRLSAVVIAMAFTTGCIASGEPGPGDEQDADSSDAAEETISTADLALTSVSYSTYQGGSGQESAAATAVDSAGNVYVTGRTSSYGTGGDIFVSKRSPNGALMYFTYFGGNGYDVGTGIAVDSAGNAYVVGYTKSYSATNDVVVAKLNPAGTALLYYNYFGGDDNDSGHGIAIDGAGNAFVTGQTLSTNFPVTAGAYQTVHGGSWDTFVTKLSPAGNTLVYSTRLGGSGIDCGTGIAVDAYGYAYVTGQTYSTNFPTTTGAFKTQYSANLDVFVTKLNSTGSSLYYSTYLGGSEYDTSNGIGIDGSSNAYITGYTQSTNFPTTWGALRTSRGAVIGAGFVTKLNDSGKGVHYSTYLGGNNGQTAAIAITVKGAGRVYVTGNTTSTSFPTTPGAFKTSFSGALDAFVAELNPAGSALAYSTYVGGSNSESGQGIAVDNAGNAHVVGYTGSTDFPTLSPTQPANGGQIDMFILKLSGP